MKIDQVWQDSELQLEPTSVLDLHHRIPAIITATLLGRRSPLLRHQFGLSVDDLAKGPIIPYKNPTPEQIEKLREYRRKHYHSNKEQYIARAKEVRDQLIAELRRRKDAPCMDCGGMFHFAAMHFDHRPGEKKLCNPCDLPRRGSRRKFEEELAKCDLVCANCHAVRTYTRMVEACQAEEVAA